MSEADQGTPQREPQPATGPSGPEWVIRHTGSDGRAHEARIVSVGATLRTYDVDGAPVISGFAADEVCPAYRGKQLMPWPNRVGDGRFCVIDFEFATILDDGTGHPVSLKPILPP